MKAPFLAVRERLQRYSLRHCLPQLGRIALHVHGDAPSPYPGRWLKDKIPAFHLPLLARELVLHAQPERGRSFAKLVQCSILFGT